MVRTETHYQTLNVSPTATQAEIKQAYRSLVKRFHPDVNQDIAGYEQITKINAAYEILGDCKQRQSYDNYLAGYTTVISKGSECQQPGWWDAQERTVSAQQRHRQQRQTVGDADAQLQQWIKQVYNPVNRLLNQILFPLEREISCLAADPFDDELMADFQIYLEECRDWLSLAQLFFGSLPNPASVAGVAAHLYYCLNHIGDGLEELEAFTGCYDDHYLHVGQEFFRIATGLRNEARLALKSIPIL
jgi:molecular chaperone DnaJ